MPWSLIRIEQRNGRIDRYGQKHQPQFRALILTSEREDAKDDRTVAEKLLAAGGDRPPQPRHAPRRSPACTTPRREEDRLIRDLLAGKTVEESIDAGRRCRIDVLADLLGEVGDRARHRRRRRAPGCRSCSTPPRTSSDAALNEIYDDRPEDHIDLRREDELLPSLAPDDLVHRLDRPAPHLSARPPEGERPAAQGDLRPRARPAQARQARQSKDPMWPEIAYLSDVHPMVDWLVDKVLIRLGRQQAPVLTADVTAPVFLIQGVYSNRLGQPTVVRVDGRLRPARRAGRSGRWTRCSPRPASARRWSTRGGHRARTAHAAPARGRRGRPRGIWRANAPSGQRPTPSRCSKYRAQLVDFSRPAPRRAARGAARQAPPASRRHRRRAARPARPPGDSRRAAAAGARRSRSVAGGCSMSFESLTNRGEYLSAHYLAEILPSDPQEGGLLKQWAERGEGRRATPRSGLRGLRRDYFDAKAELADLDSVDERDASSTMTQLRELHQELRHCTSDARPQPTSRSRPTHRRSSGPARTTRSMSPTPSRTPPRHRRARLRLGRRHRGRPGPGRRRPAARPGPARPRTEAIDTRRQARLVALRRRRTRPATCCMLSGGVVMLADRAVWGEGRYLAVSLDIALARNDDKELRRRRRALRRRLAAPPAEGGTEPLADLVAGSRQHAVGVSSELREGLRVSVELIANEVLDRIRQAGVPAEQVMELDELAKELGREALRYLYRILFLLYAEARPELGVLPVNDPRVRRGLQPRPPRRTASRRRLRAVRRRRLPPVRVAGPAVPHGQRGPPAARRRGASTTRPARARACASSRCAPTCSCRRRPSSSAGYPGARQRPGRPGRAEDRHPAAQRGPLPGAAPADAHQGQARSERGGFISYAQLGINQLGAVYEGLMSYTGFIATEELYEVAKNGDPKDGSWMIPASKVDEYADERLRLQGGRRTPACAAGSATSRARSSTGSPAGTGRPAPPTTPRSR